MTLKDYKKQLSYDLSIIQYYAHRQRASNTYREIRVYINHVIEFSKHLPAGANIQLFYETNLRALMVILHNANMVDVISHYYQLTKEAS